MIEEAYEKNRKINIRTYLNEKLYIQEIEILYFSYMMNRRLENIPTEDKFKRKLIKEVKRDLKEFYKNYNSKIDEELLSSMLKCIIIMSKESTSFSFRKIG